MLRSYSPLFDSIEVFSLVKEIFVNSNLIQFETLNDFLSYKGWVISNNTKILAVLLFTETNKIENKYYIDFICSKVPGYGSYLLEHFISNKNIYLHVEKFLNTDRLITWYEKYGFSIIDDIVEPLEDNMMKYVITMSNYSV